MIKSNQKNIYKLILFILVITLITTHDNSGNGQQYHQHETNQQDNHGDQHHDCGCGHSHNQHHQHHDHQHHDHQHHDNQHHDHQHHDHQHHDHQHHDHQHHDHQHHDHQHHDHQHHDHQHHDHSQAKTHTHTHTHSKQPSLKMIESKPLLLETLKRSPITVFFYGNNTTPEYQQFTTVIPAYNDEFYSKISTQVEFVFIPADKFKLTRPSPSLSIYQNINNGEWLMYRGIFDKTQMLNWITNNVVDPLKQFSGEEIDQFFVEGKQGFILLDFGQFYLLKTKIMLSQFCQKFQLYCGKVSHTNKALNMVIQLMRAQKQPGVPKIGYWNSKTQQLQIYTKNVEHITQTQLMQLYSGHESVIPYEAQLDVGKVIHPQTQFFEANNDGEGLQL